MPNLRIVEVDHPELVIPPEHASIHEKLQNWGRWCNSRGLHQQKVYSLEGNYRAPRGAEMEWESATPPPAPMGKPDDLEALELNLIYRLIPQEPFNYRKGLKLVYVERIPVRLCMRWLHIRHNLWVPFLYRARQMAHNLLLTSRKPHPIIQPQFEIAAKAR